MTFLGRTILGKSDKSIGIQQICYEIRGLYAIGRAVSFRIDTNEMACTRPSSCQLTDPRSHWPLATPYCPFPTNTVAPGGVAAVLKFTT